ALQLLQTDNVRLELLEPAREHVQPAVDAVDVVARDSQPTLVSHDPNQPFFARFRSSGRVAEGYPPIHPQFCRIAATIPLEQPSSSCIVVVCFGSRKTEEAWNPGNFGCRGLLVSGPRHCERSEAIQCNVWIAAAPAEPRNDDQRFLGSASASFSLLDRSGSGYLLPLAQLNSSTRSSSRISPRSRAWRHAARTAPPSGQNKKPSSRAAS